MPVGSNSGLYSNGAELIASIASSNINRPHMTKGQRAMAVAMLYPDPEKGGRGKIAERPHKLRAFHRDV